MTDAALSDHECKLRMASEGKAIYLPGKSVEEMKAELAAEAKAGERLSSWVITLSKQDWSAIDTAIPDTIEILHDVRCLLHSMAYEEDLDQPWVNAALRLAARAVQSMEEKEVATLDRLDAAIRKTNGGLQP